MKKDLTDISLTELREFIKNSEELYQIKLSHLSLISIKLRLQFLILIKQFNSFYSFYTVYLNDVNYRAFVHTNLLAQGNELFRDAEYWDIFINELLINENQKNICLFESADFYDTVTLLVCLDRYLILDKINITIVSTKNHKMINNSLVFSEKDMEMGTTNFSALKTNKKLTDYIKNEQPNKYVYTVSKNINIISLYEISESSLNFDVVIARNITLNYNFSEHEQLFNNYLKLLKSNGILFVGNKEGFKWCSRFKQLTIANKSIPIYKKI